jgi:hypothetical protein
VQGCVLDAVFSGTGGMAMALIEWTRLADRVNADGEFALAARFWDATLRLDVGPESRRLRFEAGTLREVASCERDAECDLHVSAPAEEWERLLEPVPRPFYQDLFGAQLHHDIALNANPVDFAAYYPALRRLLEILRETRGPRA